MREDSIFSAGFFEDKIKELQLKKWHTFDNDILVSYSVMLGKIEFAKINVSLQL